MLPPGFHSPKKGIWAAPPKKVPFSLRTVVLGCGTDAILPMERESKPLELNVIFGSGLPQPGASQITKDAAVAGRFAPASAIAIIHSAEIGRSEHFAMVFPPVDWCCPMSLGMCTVGRIHPPGLLRHCHFLDWLEIISSCYRSFHS